MDFLSLSYNFTIMDAKITLSFEKEVIDSAKKFAERHNISLSRLTEHLYRQITTGNYYSLEDFPIADWVNQVAEDQAEYKITPRRNQKSEYYASRKK